MSYRDELLSELTAVGITGAQRSRIVAEFEDHLHCDPAADLGAPRLVARRFADELGTSRARRAALTAFAALAVAGILFAAAFLTSPAHAFGSLPYGAPWLTRVGNWLGLLAPQFAFAAGGLALLRAVRRRGATVIPGAETRLLLRRATVGVVAGLISMAALALIAIEINPWLPSWWTTLAIAGAGLGALALLAATPALLAARRLPSLAEGSRGDMFDDIGGWLPAAVDGRPWRVALLLAGAIVALFTVTGFMASDGYDGIARGVFDALLCLAGFATVGRYLGLWTPRSAAVTPD